MLACGAGYKVRHMVKKTKYKKMWSKIQVPFAVDGVDILSSLS